MIQFLSEYICIHTGFLLCVTCVPHVLCVILAEAQYEQAAICLHHQIIFFPPTLLWRGFVWTPKCRDQRLEIRFKGIYYRTVFLRKYQTRRAGRQAGLSGGSVKVSQWSRKRNGEALEVLHMKETKHQHETQPRQGKIHMHQRNLKTRKYFQRWLNNRLVVCMFNPGKISRPRVGMSGGNTAKTPSPSTPTPSACWTEGESPRTN